MTMPVKDSVFASIITTNFVLACLWMNHTASALPPEQGLRGTEKRLAGLEETWRLRSMAEGYWAKHQDSDEDTASTATPSGEMDAPVLCLDAALALLSKPPRTPLREPVRNTFVLNWLSEAVD